MDRASKNRLTANLLAQFPGDTLVDRIARADAAQGFALDGFPRNLDQAKALDDALARERLDRCFELDPDHIDAVTLSQEIGR